MVNQFLQTSKPQIFAAGNVVIVYDLADNVSDEGMRAGRNAALYVAGDLPSGGRRFEIKGGKAVRLFSPQWITDGGDATVFFRVVRPFECRCKVFADHGLFAQTHRYARPGEMNEVHLSARDLRSLDPGVTSLTVDVEEV